MAPASPASSSRCAVCQMRAELCLCAEIPRLETATRLVVLMHHRELKATTNTARLALAAIAGSELRVRGLPKPPSAPGAGENLLEPGRQAALLFPCPEAAALNAAWVASHPGPYTLIVPDGNWRQARKVLTREPALAGVPRVRLPWTQPSGYGLRREPRVDALSTCEAIARALGVLESREIQARLETVFRTMVSRTLSSRGYKACPQAALRSSLKASE